MRNALLYLIGLVAVIGLFAVPSALYTYGTEEIVTVTVSEKERITSGSGSGITSKYLVWTEEGETFELTDSLLRGHFSASDLYGRLDEGVTYRAVVYGWRIPFLSTYRNVVELEVIQ